MYEFPTGSGNLMNLQQIASELTKKLLKIFERDGGGKFQYHANHHPHFTTNDHFKDHHLFYEYFHGDTGRGWVLLTKPAGPP